MPNMNKEEFNLSEKIEPKLDVGDVHITFLEPLMKVEDVKEFIRLLKERMKTCFVYEEKICFDNAVDMYFYELAGDKLNGK